MDRREFLALALGLPMWADSRSTSRPKLILILRHAEKSGDKSGIHLNARGFERAAALPRLFPARFETPDFLFASRASEHSNRPLETITPLAKALHLAIDDRFANEDYAALAKELLSNPAYAEKVVLVCWHHGKIPALAAELGVANPPAPWPDTQFDHAWRIGYSNGAATFTDASQRLLEGDAAENFPRGQQR
jgi:broad specificity phosphatase PhoE